MDVKKSEIYEYLKQHGKASIAELQSALCIGYVTARTLLKELEASGNVRIDGMYFVYVEAAEAPTDDEEKTETEGESEDDEDDVIAYIRKRRQELHERLEKLRKERAENSDEDDEDEDSEEEDDEEEDEDYYSPEDFGIESDDEDSESDEDDDDEDEDSKDGSDDEDEDIGELLRRKREELMERLRRIVGEDSDDESEEDEDSSDGESEKSDGIDIEKMVGMKRDQIMEDLKNAENDHDEDEDDDDADAEDSDDDDDFHYYRNPDTDSMDIRLLIHGQLEDAFKVKVKDEYDNIYSGMYYPDKSPYEISLIKDVVDYYYSDNGLTILKISESLGKDVGLVTQVQSIADEYSIQIVGKELRMKINDLDDVLPGFIKLLAAIERISRIKA